jgi:periplasmic copper chaperone A
MNRRTVSLPRPATRLGIVLAALVGLLTLGIGSASAHVTVTSPDAAPGGYGKVSFRVPNESDAASTVRVRIQLPTDAPLASVAVQPVPGWTATSTRTRLDPPVTDDDGNQVTEAVSVVEFAADAGGGVRPGEFQEFSLAVGPFPKADALTFKVVQTYSDGTEAAWIDPTVAGQPEPEHPAPVLSLTGASAGHGSDQASDPGATQNTDSGNGTAVAALVLAVVALLLGIGGLVLGWTARRRTVSS